MLVGNDNIYTIDYLWNNTFRQQNKETKPTMKVLYLQAIKTICWAMMDDKL